MVTAIELCFKILLPFHVETWSVRMKWVSFFEAFVQKTIIPRILKNPSKASFPENLSVKSVLIASLQKDYILQKHLKAFFKIFPRNALIGCYRACKWNRAIAKPTFPGLPSPSKRIHIHPLEVYYLQRFFIPQFCIWKVLRSLVCKFQLDFFSLLMKIPIELFPRTKIIFSTSLRVE